nr:hypothetical protein [Tanacetum cinerariifolium]
GAWWLLGSSGKGAGKSWEWWSGVESGGGGAVKVGEKIDQQAADALHQ